MGLYGERPSHSSFHDLDCGTYQKKKARSGAPDSGKAGNFRRSVVSATASRAQGRDREQVYSGP